MQTIQCPPLDTATPTLLTLLHAAQDADHLNDCAPLVRFLERVRPRVQVIAALLCAGLRRHRVDAAEATDHAVVTLAAALDTCRATTETAVQAWISTITVDAVVELHGMRRTRTPRARRVA
jgi:hypothetical protein